MSFKFLINVYRYLQTPEQLVEVVEIFFLPQCCANSILHAKNLDQFDFNTVRQIFDYHPPIMR